MITPDNIRDLINDMYDVDIGSQDRTTNISMMRFVYAYLAFKYCTHHTFEKIGLAINRDHSSISYALRKFNNTLAYDKRLKQIFSAITKEFDKKFSGSKDVIEIREYCDLSHVSLSRRLKRSLHNNEKLQNRICSLRTQNNKLKKRLK